MLMSMTLIASPFMVLRLGYGLRVWWTCVNARNVCWTNHLRWFLWKFHLYLSFVCDNSIDVRAAVLFMSFHLHFSFDISTLTHWIDSFSVWCGINIKNYARVDYNVMYTQRVWWKWRWVQWKENWNYCYKVAKPQCNIILQCFSIHLSLSLGQSSNSKQQ